MTAQHNPETIRALLAGITAGEWVITPEKDGTAILAIMDEGMEADGPWLMWPEHAAFIAAGPGIARYALELAAENERLKLKYESADFCAACGDRVVAGSPRRIFPWHEGCFAELEAAFDDAPQPAPTDGTP